MDFKHKSVMLQETVEALQIKPSGTYIDGTAGGGGHSSEILKRLTSGRLIMIDQDPDAIAFLKEKFRGAKNVDIVNDNFSNMDVVAKNLGISAVDGILLDIGVSSHQLDTPQRGFSYHYDAPLDMRMSQSGLSAYDVVNDFSEDDLVKIIFTYGEEKFARSIVRAIVLNRAERTIETTLQLAEIVKSAVPFKARRDKHPARKTFQALRIFVNSELDVLRAALEKAFALLNKGGRLVVITFHSLEDRLVKKCMAEWCQGCTCPPDFPVCVCGKKTHAVLVSRKALEPTQDELATNKRSRSAKLRVCEKL